MNTYYLEEMAWLRIQDLQREAENRRLLRGSRLVGWMSTLRQVVRAVRRLVSATAAGRSVAAAETTEVADWAECTEAVENDAA